MFHLLNLVFHDRTARCLFAFQSCSVMEYEPEYKTSVTDGCIINEIYSRPEHGRLIDLAGPSAEFRVTRDKHH